MFIDLFVIAPEARLKHKKHLVPGKELKVEEKSIYRYIIGEKKIQDMSSSGSV